MESVGPSQVAPATHPRRASTPIEIDSFYVRLSPRGFCFSWWVLLTCHAFVGSFAFSVTALHRYMEREEVTSSVAVLNIPKRTLQFTAWLFLAVGIGHAVAIARMVYYSVLARELAVLELETSTTPVYTSTKNQKHRMSALCRRETGGSWGKYFGANGLFGFNGKYFEEGFMVREMIEIAMQTYQAHRLSRSVPRLWINQLAVGSIVVNCVLSPLVHYLLPERQGLRRLISVLLDTLLDVCGSIVIPLAIIFPYVQLYDTMSYNFPFDLLMNDVWFVNAISENRQVLVTSMLDFVSTVLPHLSILLSLNTIKIVLRRESTRVHHVTEISIGKERTPSATSMAVPVCVELNTSATSVPHKCQRQRSTVPKRVRMAVHGLWVVWGVVILALHLMAMRR